ncbi:AAA family ATPase [Microbacterium sp. HD4P20]|uniref:helix-turn-helix transcriptional regulator n=1 Tax=Microbacterium sp. HD4P20 TaxID=2864874 RepID=UPI001C63E0BE|nr:LuxR family transcriptional regulator [Microbacterium sp. HD4P20]MCP2635233.1 AAA family ATPase [Microbacterium sp. HD4P20]
MPALTSTPRMVGRRAELDALLGALDDGVAGRPVTVVVRGEAGIGKTRLVQEFLAEATERGGELPVTVAIGQCVDLGPIGAPFGPIRRVLRDLHAAVGTEELRKAAGSVAVIASLAALVPGIAAEHPDTDDPAGEFAEAIEVVLEQLSQERHVIVVIEDLQWADASTMALLKTLASTLRGRHLTIVATYRSDDIDRFHPLRPVLAELDRTRSVVRVDVERLSPEEVAEQVAQLAPDLDPRVIEDLAERSGGIPFLVEELVDLGDRGLPDTLRELVLARYARVGDAAQQTVRTMAAGGMHVDHEVLAAVSPLDDRALDLAVREAIDARVILADGAGYSFRHALTREAVESDMLPSERVRTHRRYAEVLRDGRADSPDEASAIAEHWLAARDLPAAFDATVAALQQSRARYSPATSVKLAERLTELWEQVPDAAARAGTTLPELHLGAAEGWHDLGDSERALRSAKEGLAVCPDDPFTRAALLRQRFVEVFNFEHRNQREDLLAAIDLLEGIDDERADALLSRVFTNLAIGDDGATAQHYAQRAITLAERAGDNAALGVALTVESWRIADDEDDEPRALAPVQRAAALPLDPALRSYTGSALVDLLVRLGRFDEAVIFGEQRYADAVRAGIERGSGASVAYSLARALFSMGRAEDALRYARRARRLTKARGSVVRLIATHLSWNDQAAARDELLSADWALIEESLRTHPKKRTSWAIDRAEACASIRGLPPAPAAEREAALADVLEVATGDAPPALRRHAAVTAAMLLAVSDRDGRDDRRRALAAAVDAWPDRAAAPIMAGFVRALLADAGPVGHRVEQWRGVVADLEAGITPVWHLHVARCLLASALLEHGDRDEAAALLRRVSTEAPGHGVARVARWATELAAQAGLTAGAETPDTPGGADLAATLTPRERQVLELIAEGLTNPQIGRRLFISPKTASVHVSAILAKIGASNRAEAAALYTAALAP